MGAIEDDISQCVFLSYFARRDKEEGKKELAVTKTSFIPPSLNNVNVRRQMD